MTQMYGHSFTSAWGDEDLGVWQKIIFSFSTFIVTEALCYLLNKNHRFTDFPPNPMQFRRICEEIVEASKPRPASKLTAPCDVCGCPGKLIEHEGNKTNDTLCYEHFWKKYHPNSDKTAYVHKAFPLDKDEIRVMLEKIGYNGEKLEIEIGYRLQYHKNKHESYSNGAKELRKIFENG